MSLDIDDIIPDTELDLSKLDPENYNENNKKKLIVKVKNLNKYAKTPKFYDLLSKIFGGIHIGCKCENGKENEYKLFGEVLDGPSLKAIFDYKYQNESKFSPVRKNAWIKYKNDNLIDDNGNPVKVASHEKPKTQEDIDKQFLEQKARIMNTEADPFEDSGSGDNYEITDLKAEIKDLKKEIKTMKKQLNELMALKEKMNL